MISGHDCVVCTDCIEETFDPRNPVNYCRTCGEPFKDDLDITIRPIVEAKLSDDIIENIYFKPCPLCNTKKDSRKFIEICKNLCKVCDSCRKTINDKNTVICTINNCGKDISIQDIQFRP